MRELERQREEGEQFKRRIMLTPFRPVQKLQQQKRLTVKQRLRVPVLIVTRRHGAQIITTLRATTKRETVI